MDFDQDEVPFFRNKHRLFILSRKVYNRFVAGAISKMIHGRKKDAWLVTWLVTHFKTHDSWWSVLQICSRCYFEYASWRMTCLMTHDSWLKTHDSWLMTHDSWLMTHDFFHHSFHASWRTTWHMRRYSFHDSWLIAGEAVQNVQKGQKESERRV